MLFFIVPLIITFIVFFILLSLKFIKRPPEVKATMISSMKWLFFAFSVAAGLFCFINDKSTYFECRKETNACVYYRSTIFNPEMRFADKIPLTARSTAFVKKVKRHRKHSSYYEYTVMLVSANSEYELPMVFRNEEWATEEKVKLNRFLTGERDRYVYMKGSPEPTLNDFEKGLLFTFYVTTLIFVLWLIKEWRRKRTRVL